MNQNRNIFLIILFLIIIIASLCYNNKETFNNDLTPLDLTYDENNEINFDEWIYKANAYAKEMKYQDKLQKSNQNINYDNEKSDKLLLKNNKFKKNCCPATYTSSNGCACLTDEQINYLSNRAGNIMYSINTY